MASSSGALGDEQPEDELDERLASDVRCLRAILAADNYESTSEDEDTSNCSSPIQEVAPGRPPQ